jgi:hypothetical protein
MAPGLSHLDCCPDRAPRRPPSGIVEITPGSSAPWHGISASLGSSARSTPLIWRLCLIAPAQCEIDAFNECGWLERLAQKAKGAAFKRMRLDALVGESADENNRNAVALRAQQVLQLDSRHGRHLDVHDQTAGTRQVR